MSRTALTFLEAIIVATITTASAALPLYRFKSLGAASVQGFTFPLLEEPPLRGDVVPTGRVTPGVLWSVGAPSAPPAGALPLPTDDAPEEPGMPPPLLGPDPDAPRGVP
jgi:hypothetical protein